MDDPNPAVEELLKAALALSREQRSAFLEATLHQHPDVYGKLIQMLVVHDELLAFTATTPSTSTVDAEVVKPLKPLPPTATKLGRYQLREVMGAGGMGIVYRALDTELDRLVAIKILQESSSTEDDARRRFRREALALAKLNHPHIAAVHDVGEQHGTAYIVMELIEGESLSSRLRRGALPPAEATRIVGQVAEALQEAHQQSVIHRDLKPANIMITLKGQVKVLDFGIAKLASQLDPDMTMTKTPGVLGTPSYMSPEQILGKEVDQRSDLWSLGVLYYESIAGHTPFHASNNLATLRAIVDEPLPALPATQPELPPPIDQILRRALQKNPDQRYQTAAELLEDTQRALATMSGSTPSLIPTPAPAQTFASIRWIAVSFVVLLLIGALLSAWLFHRASDKRWAREEAVPQINRLIEQRLSLKAFAILEQAENILPADPALQQLETQNTTAVSVTSDPAGAKIELQDYLDPTGPWRTLGVTPLSGAKIPKGYFRWRISKPGIGQMTVAPENRSDLQFPLRAAQAAPPGMVYSPREIWATYAAFLGWLGPYELPDYYIDRDEVTNRDYQRFLDAGGYANKSFWPAEFQQDGHTLPWSEGILLFRDSSGRPGPSTWAGGHYPQGQENYPVSGVSWFEASAYAKWAGKTLPVLAQWDHAAPGDLAEYTVQLSNIAQTSLKPVGVSEGLGPFGTNDTAGNVREWVANVVDNNLRFILGGSWKSPAYLYSSPEALSPYDRSDTNGFRCVRNLGSLPEGSTKPFHRISRDFSTHKAPTEEVFNAYKLLYAYDKTPLNAKLEGVVGETVDWKEEKVSFDTAYNGERMSAYLFLPKRIKPPYQTLLFFPSARVEFLTDDSGHLGDTKFFDYILQSGRAVMYPVYQDTYERRIRKSFPGGAQNINLTTEWYKDAARSLDYLNTRSDIDSSKLAYLGVSMGSAEGVIAATLLQDRLQTAIFLDGGYFLDPPPPGGDQADFAPHMKKPVLMVNGRYDYTFPLDSAQDPLFLMLGTPDSDKQHIVLDTPHDVTEQRSQLVKAVLSWLDRYMGRVSQ